MNAGIVKIAPAATDSPIEPAVRAIFSSRIEPFEQPQHGHADDRGRIGRGDRDTSPKPKIGVRRPEDHA